MWSLEKRLLAVEATIFSLALASWWVFGSEGLEEFGRYLFRAGLIAIVLGLLIVVGAWTGVRTMSAAYLRANDPHRLLRDRRYLEGTWSDLNVLAMAGTIAIIVSLLILR